MNNLAAQLTETFPFNKFFDYTRVSEDDLNYYLKFVNYYSKSSSSSISGNLLLKGLHSFESNALKVLRECNYDIGQAFHKILFPVLDLLGENSTSNLEASQSDPMIFVNSALNDLIGSNIQEKEAWLDHVKQRIEMGISLPDLEDIIELGGKMKIDIPDYVNRQIELSLNFSKIIKRHLNEKNSIDDINNLLEETRKYKVKTEEFLQLEDILKKANICLLRSQEFETSVIHYKTLQVLYHDTKNLPVYFPNFEAIKSRYLKAQKWQEKYSKIPKHSKTRGQANSSIKKGHSKDERCTIAYLYQMIMESEEINFTSNDVVFLKNNFEKLRESEARITMTLHDHKIEKTKEMFNDFANTLDSLKFTTDLYDQIVSQLEYISWEEKKNNSMNNKILKLKHLRALLKEANQKNLNSVPEIRKFKKTLANIEAWMDKMTNIFYNCMDEEEEEDEEIKITKSTRDEKKRYNICDLIEFYEEGKSFSLKPEEIEHLLLKCEEFFEFREECKKVGMSGIGCETNSEYDFEKLNSMKKTIAKYNIKCEEFTIIENQMNLVQLWGLQYEAFYVQYKKLEIDFKFSFPKIESIQNRLDIIEMLENFLRKSNVFHENLLELIIKIPHFAKFSKEYQDLMELKYFAENHMELTSFTSSSKSDKELFKFYPNEMDLDELQGFIKISHSLCISRDFFNNLLGVFRTKSWLRVAFLKEKISLQDAEMLLKEAQTINFNNTELEKIRQNIQKTKEWVRSHRKIVSRKDKTKYEELKRVVKEGMELPLQTAELDYLLNFENVCEEEILEVKDFLQREHTISELEDYYKSLVSFPVSEVPEFDLILAITKAAQEWRILVNKIFQSRQLSELYFKIDLTQSNQIQNNYFPDLSPEESQKISISQEIAEQNKKEISSPLQSEKNSIYHQKIEVELTEESEPNGFSMSKKKQKKVLKEEKKTSFKKFKKKTLKTFYNNSIQNIYVEAYLNVSSDLKAIFKKIEQLDNFSKCQYLQNHIPLREDTPNEKYCICRKGDDGINYMLMCENCKEWFHGACVKISLSSAEKINQYICVCCSRRKDIFTNSYNLDILNYKRISKSRLVEIMLEGSEIATSLDEMKILEICYEQITIWHRNYETSLNDLLEYEKGRSGLFSELDETFEKTLINLYQESEGFMVDLDEATNIITILKQFDFFKQAHKLFELKKVTEKGFKKLVCHAYSIFNINFLSMNSEIENSFFSFMCKKGLQALTEITKLYEKSALDIYSDFKNKYEKRYYEVIDELLSRYDPVNDNKQDVKDLVEEEIEKLKVWENNIDNILTSKNFNEKLANDLYEKSKDFNFKFGLVANYAKYLPHIKKDLVEYYRCLIFAESKKKKEQVKKIKKHHYNN
jgi:hypothetical protein